MKFNVYINVNVDRIHPCISRTHEKTHLKFCLDFLVWDHIEVLVIPYPRKKTHPPVFVLSFGEKRCVSYTGGYGMLSVCEPSLVLYHLRECGCVTHPVSDLEPIIHNYFNCQVWCLIPLVCCVFDSVVKIRASCSLLTRPPTAVRSRVVELLAAPAVKNTQGSFTLGASRVASLDTSHRVRHA